MTRLVVVSNRVGPLRDSGRAGGLAVGLVDALKKHGGLWFGWSGNVSGDGTFGPVRIEEGRKVRLATIDLTPDDEELFYAGYANRVLWPVLHYRLDLADFDRRFQEGYRRVNGRFAARLKPLLQPDDVVWVHDYHFFRLGAELRGMGVDGPIGFFLHVPFPPPEILTALPGHGSLVRALLAYDVIGFQTAADAANLRRFLLEEAGGRMIDEERVEAYGRAVTVKAFPIGIDAQGFANMALSEEARRQEMRIARLLHGRLQIVGVDRIDYSKGLPERFRAFGRLLEDYPENRGAVSLMQIAPPSRSELEAYVDIRRTLEELTGHINGRFSDVDWTPIRFLSRSFPRRALAGIYRASRVALVTPLRDGMNLVAKEYVAAQNPDNPGVLILSRFAGAAEELKEALIVNPYSTEGVAEALQTALRMPLEERKERWAALAAQVWKVDAATWASNFIAKLVEASAFSDRAAARAVAEAAGLTAGDG